MTSSPNPSPNPSHPVTDGLLERWPGYDDQSWQQRFLELDRRYERLWMLSFRAAILKADLPCQVNS